MRRKIRTETVLMPLCPPQITPGHSRVRTQASKLKSESTVGKVKLSRYSHADDKGERRNISYSLLTSVLDGVNDQRHAQAKLYPG
jgi:hypothetical protein